MNELSEEDIKQILEGLLGEKTIRDYLKSKRIHFFQVDLMARIKNKWHLIEVKHQEAFTPPPFKGHGLPKWQIDSRLDFQIEMDIRAMLFVIDKITNIIYWQYMDKLMDGEKYQTTGKKPRLIFPLTSYNILTL